MNIGISNLLSVKDLSKKDIELIFKTADTFVEVINRKIKKVPSLTGYTVANLFFENSTRTKLSFELAAKRLSADTINFSSSASSIKKGESLIDTVNNIISMKTDIIVIRHPFSGTANLLSKNVDATIINGGDGCNEHPTQALLDAYSIRKKIGQVKSKNIVIIGDLLHSRVAFSNMYMLNTLGANVAVCSFFSLIPKHIESLNVKIIKDIREALEWCDIAIVLRVQNERHKIKFFSSIREYRSFYGINRKLLDSINKDIVIMHPGPVNRGIELDSDVVDSDYAIILDQVENGIVIRMAILYLLAMNRKIG